LTHPHGPDPIPQSNGQGRPFQSQPIQPVPKKKRTRKRRALWVCGVILVVAAIASVTGNKAPAGPSAASAALSATVSTATTTSTAVSALAAKPSTAMTHASAKSAPQAAAAKVPSKTSPTGTAAAPSRAVPTPKTYRGNGDDIVKINLGGQPAVVKFICARCTGNTTLTSNGDSSLLVNVVGAYSGERAVDALTGGTATSKLTITADSSWTVVVSSIGAVKPVVSSAKGHGDAVLVFSGAGTQASVTNANGTSNFVVTGYGASFPELAVNVIGLYKGTVALTTPGLVQIESDGDWTLTAAP